MLQPMLLGHLAFATRTKAKHIDTDLIVRCCQLMDGSRISKDMLTKLRSLDMQECVAKLQ